MTLKKNEHGKKHVPPPPLRPWKKAFFSYTEEEADDERKQKANEVAKGLEKIYLAEGKKDLGVLEHAKPHRVRRFFLWLILMCGLASVAAWAGLIWLQPNAEIQTIGLKMEIQGSSTVILGQEQTFVVKYQNQTFQPISDTQIRIAWPADFQLILADPASSDTQNNAWNIGLLAPGASGEITIKGMFLGSLGAKSTLQAIATYQSSGQSRVQEALATQNLDYEASVFDGRLILPAKAIAGEQVPLVFEFENRSQTEVSGLIARFELPEGFVLSSTSGTPLLASSNGKDWEMVLPNLSASSTATWRWSGAFISGSSGDVNFTVQVGKRRESEFLKFFQKQQTIPVLAGDLSLRMVANGSDKDRSISPGDVLRITLSYKNISPETLGDVSITLGIESLINGSSAQGSTLMNWSGLENESRGTTNTQARIQTIRFDKDTNPDFANLAPGKEGIIEVSIPTIQATNQLKEAAILLDITGSLARVGEETIARTIKANPIKIQYRTDADLQTVARYFTEEGAPLGTGPLPPEVGKTTTYRIEWIIKKQLHAIDNIEVTTALPENVTWSGQALADAGDMMYDDRTKTVIWKLNRMPEDVQELVARFDISLTPSELDLSRFARLIGVSKMQAKDTVVNEEIRIEKPAISTDLQEDEGAQGKGVVIETKD